MSVFVLFPIGVIATSQNVILLVVSAYSSQNPYAVDRNAFRSRDGSGLTAGLSGITGGADSTHGRVANGTMWTTRGNTAEPIDTSPSITFDLGAATDLQSIRIWNYNENTFTRFGAKGIRISTSSNNTTFTTLGDTEVWANYVSYLHQQVKEIVDVPS